MSPNETAWPFWTCPTPPRRGHLLKAYAIDVAKHPIRNEPVIARRTSAKVKIEIPVVIQVAKITAHREEDHVKVSRFGDIGKRAILWL